jgi:HEAT repeat protein
MDRVFRREARDWWNTVALGLLEVIVVSAETSNRRAAAIFLGSFGSEAERAIPYLVNLLTDADGKVRSDAAASLGKIGQAALPALMVAARHESAELRDCARLIIERIEGQS